MNKFKGKILIWIIVFAIAVVITNFKDISTFVTNLFAEQRDPLSISVFTNERIIIDNISSINNAIKTEEKEGFIVSYSINDINADIIISDKEITNIPENYIPIENANSPIIMVGSDWIEETNSIFNSIPKKIDNTTHNTYSCDFEDILVAIQNDQSWKDLGALNDENERKVSLVIPKTNTLAGKCVYNYIYSTLEKIYPQKTPTEIVDLTELIISKSRQTSSISTELNDFDEKGKKSKYIYDLWVIPEYMIAGSKEVFSCNSTNQLYPIYFNDSVAIGYYVYARNDVAFLEKFDKYSQEIIMEQLLIRYGNNNVAFLSQKLHNFKTLVPSETIFTNDIVEKYEEYISLQKDNSTNATIDQNTNGKDIESENKVETQEDEVEVEDENNAENNEQTSTEDESSDSGLFLIIIFVIAIIAVLCLCYFFSYY